MARTPRTNGQRFFLTYSQAENAAIDELADFLHSLAPGWLEIVQEAHEDGGIHYHVVLCYDERFQRPLDVFDHAGYHPNILPIKNATTDLNNRRHYIRKGAERSEADCHTIKDHKRRACDYTIEPDTRGDVPEYLPTAGRLNWGGILDAATTADDFFALVRLNQPKDWVLRNDQVVKYAATHYKEAEEPEEVFAPESWNVPAAMDDWVKSVFAEVSFFCSGTFTRTSLGILSVDLVSIFSRNRAGRKPSSLLGQPDLVRPCGPNHSVVTLTCADCGIPISSTTGPTTLF